MKITNWRKKLATAIVAAGIMVPGVASAVNITVPDGDFKTFDITRSANYAYAHGPGADNAYRPTSPWVDDYGRTGQDIGEKAAGGNWLYNSAYATATAIYPFPHGVAADDQAMVGSNHFAGQTLSTDTFQADTTYTFSLWAQGLGGTDQAASGSTQRLFMYLFNGDDPTTLNDIPGVALLRTGFRGDQGAFQPRATGSSDADSQANWTQLSTSVTVPAGSPFIGQHIGVGLYLYKFTAVDDVSLTALSLAVPTTADYNHDGFVDAADYVLWRAQKNTSVTPGTGADGTSDGMVNEDDYNLWRSHFGEAAGSGSANLSTGEVPEPGMGVLASIGAFLFSIGSRWRARRRVPSVS